MTTTISTPAQVVNLALTKIGYKMRVANLFDGSEAAKRALDIYGAARDRVLYDGDWDFAERSVQAVLLKQAPTIPPNYIVKPWTTAYPSLPWYYEYAYPPDCLKVRSVKRLPAFIPNYDPRYNNFSVDNDIGYSPPRKVILTNVPNAIIVYTGQITNPYQWNEAFLDTFTDELGKALGPVLTGIDSFKLAEANEQEDMAAANMNKQRG